MRSRRRPGLTHLVGDEVRAEGPWGGERTPLR
jgi:hypothetical protein